MSITKKKAVLIAVLVAVLIISGLVGIMASQSNEVLTYQSQTIESNPLAVVDGSVTDSVVAVGSNLGVATSGTQVSTQDGLKNAIQANQNIVLTGNITLSDYTAPDVVYTGTIYGQGHTITINVSATTRIASGSKTSGYYGLLVRQLNGTIRDLSIKIAPQATTTNIGLTLHLPQIGIDFAPANNARVQVIGGVIGKLNGGTVHNVKVTLENNTIVTSANADGFKEGNVYSGSDTRYYAGLLAGHSYNGTVSCVEVINNGTWTNLGMAKGTSTNGSFVSAVGGVIGLSEGTTNLNRVSVGGSGYIKAEAHFVKNWNESVATYHSINIAGGIIGYVHNGKTSINGVYMNYTSASAVQSYYASEASLSTWKVYQTRWDDYRNDRYVSTNSSWWMYHALRASYGVGSVNLSNGTMSNMLSLRNVYMSKTMIDNKVLDNHRYAAIGIRASSKTAGDAMVADAYKWKFTVIDTTKTSLSWPIPANSSDVGNNSVSPNKIILTINNNDRSNFLHSIVVGDDTYNFAEQTYNLTGSLKVEVGYIGFNGANGSGDCVTANTSPVTSEISDYASESWPMTINYAQWLYMDYDMLRAYNDDTTTTRQNAYTGSGSNYTYTYDGNRMYVPAFSGYLNEDLTGGKISFSAVDLDNILKLSDNGGSIDIKLTSADGSTEYEWNSHRYNGAGNVGMYKMTYTKPQDQRFITVDGKTYYCHFKDDYTINIQVLPYNAQINWSDYDNLVYDATTKQISYNLVQVAGTELGNDDINKMTLSVSYTCDDPSKLQGNLPLHAGDYLATAQLSYDGSTANPMTNNYVLTNPTQNFTVQKRTLTIAVGNAQSTYGDDHSTKVESVGATLQGDTSWASDDSQYFVFSTSTQGVFFNTDIGSYPIKASSSVIESAPANIAGDYEFNFVDGTLQINKRAINGTMTLNGGVYNGTDGYGATLKVDGNVIVGGDSDVYSIKYQQDGQEELIDSFVNVGKYFVKLIINDNNYSLGNIVVNDEIYTDSNTFVQVDKRSVDIDLLLDENMVYTNTSKVSGWQLSDTQPENGGIVGDDQIDVTLSFAGQQYNSVSTPVLPDIYTASATSQNDNYVIGNITNAQFEIKRATLGIEILQSTFVYDGTQKQISYKLVGIDENAVDGLIGETVVKYNSALTLPTDVASYVVQISVAQGSCYESAVFETYQDKPITLDITQADMTISPVGVSDGNYATDYNGKVQEISFDMSADGLTSQDQVKSLTTVTYTKAEVEGFVKDAGVYNVVIDFVGTRNYKPAQVSFVWTVNKIDLTLQYDQDAVYTYSGEAQNPQFAMVTAVEGDSFGELTTSIEGQNASDGKAINAGEYVLNISVADHTNYNAFSGSIEFVIGKYVLRQSEETTQYITLKEVEGVANTTIADYLSDINIIVYNQNNENVESMLTKAYYTDHSEGEELTNFEYVEGIDSKFSIKLTLPENANYAFDGGWIDIIVLRANITIKVTIDEGDQQELQGNTVELSYGQTLKLDYTAQYNDVDQTQNLATEWLKYDSQSGQWQALPSETIPQDAGRYQMVIYLLKDQSSAIAMASEYSIDGEVLIKKTMFLTISPKEITVTIQDSSFVYGEDIDTSAFSHDNAGLEDITITLNYTTEAQKFANAGKYAISATLQSIMQGDVDVKANYNVTIVNGNLSITKKTIYVKANDIEANYGEEAVFDGFKMYEDAQAETQWIGDVNNPISVRFAIAESGRLYVGKYDIIVTPNQSLANENYDIQFTTTPGKLTVVARDITLDIGDINVIYGSEDLSGAQGGNISIAQGQLLSGDTIALPVHSYINGSALNTLGVQDGGYTLGEYVKTTVSIMAGEEDITANYNITFTDTAKLIILPKTITVDFKGFGDGEQSIDTQSIEYNAKVWNAEYDIIGVINDDSVALDIDIQGGEQIKDAGSYTIRLSLGNAQTANKNYTFEIVSKTLTVLPKQTTVQGVESSYNYTYGDARQALNPNIATIEGDSEAGEFNIVYYVGENTSVTGTQIGWEEKWNAGTYTAVITYSGKNYIAQNVNVVFNIAKKQVVIGDIANTLNTTFDFVYDTTVKNVGITEILSDTTSVYDELQDSLYVVFLLQDQVLTNVKNAGVYEIDIAMRDNINYEIADGNEYLLSQRGTMTIAKAESSSLSFALGLMNAEYSASDLTQLIKENILVSGIGNEIVKDGTINLTVLDESQMPTTPVNAGRYSIKIEFVGSTNYKDLPEIILHDKFTIDKVLVSVDSIELEDKTFVYDTTTHSLVADGLPVGSSVYLGATYSYDGEIKDGLVNATNSPAVVELKVYFDAVNAKLSDGSEVIEEYQGKSAYVYTLQANMTIAKAKPVIKTDASTTSYYYDGKTHFISFAMTGVGSDIEQKNYSYSYNVEDGLNGIVIDGLGTISIAYYKDSSYTDKLVDGNGSVLPQNVLIKDGKVSGYYMQVEFVSQDPNYQDYTFKNISSEMILVILKSVITIEFGSLEVNYGQLADRADVLEYVNANMKYDYYVEDMTDNSLDISSILSIAYNVGDDITVDAGKIAIIPSVSALDPDSCSVILMNTSDVVLEILPVDITEDMASGFADITSVYGEKTYTQDDIGFAKPIGVLGEEVNFAISLDGSQTFSISDAGEYVLKVEIPQGNYNEWSKEIKLTISPLQIEVEYSIDGEKITDGRVEVEFDGNPVNISVASVDTSISQSVVASYYKGDTMLDQAPVSAGEYTVKAVFDSPNYVASADSESITLVILAGELQEDIIKSWISDKSDVFGSSTGLDLSKVPEQYEITVVYTSAVNSYDQSTIKDAIAGTYTAKVTLTDGEVQGSAEFAYTVTKLDVQIKVSLTATYGVLPTAQNVSIDSTLSNNDTVTVKSLTLKDGYDKNLAVGHYAMKDYVKGIELTLGKGNDNYVVEIVYGDFAVAPAQAPSIASLKSNYNNIIVTMQAPGLYAYKTDKDNQWKFVDQETDNFTITGLSSSSSYEVYVAYAEFLDIVESDSTVTTYDPYVLQNQINELLQSGVTAENKPAYDRLVSLYSMVSEDDKAVVKTDYERLVSEFSALNGDGDKKLTTAITVISIIVVVAGIGAAVGVIITVKKKKKANKSDSDDDSQDNSSNESDKESSQAEPTQENAEDNQQ